MASTKSHSAGTELATARPLISVVCRTMGRPELEDALESLHKQTYPRLEIILVDAAGNKLQPDDLPLKPDAIEIVSGAGPLNRPEAANVGLDNAHGDYLLFLDEDDWIAPEHIANLVEALRANPDKKAAYSNTVKTTPEGNQLSDVFNQDWDPAFLRRDNFLPIHSVLFAASLVKEGCRFDEELSIFEDWDFWLQTSTLTDFVHVDKNTAFYRQGGESETAVQEEADKFKGGHPTALGREKVLNKWRLRWSGSDINQMIRSLEDSKLTVLTDRNNALEDKKKILEATQKELENLRQGFRTEIADLNKKLRNLNKVLEDKNRQINAGIERLHARDRALESSNRQLKEQRVDFENLGSEHQRLMIQHEELDRGVREILNSFSWRVTSPYRFIRHKLSKGFVSKAAKSEANEFSDTQRSGSETALTEREDAPGAITWHLDSPSEDRQLFSDALVLQGWALADTGPASLTVFIDGLEYRSIDPVGSRPDVARFNPHLRHAANCGFFEKIPLPYIATGPHQLRLRASAPGAVERELEVSFYLFQAIEIYNAWLRCKQEEDRRNQQSLNDRLAKGPELCLRVICLLEEGSSSDPAIASLARQSGIEYHLYLIGAGWREQENALDGKRDYLAHIEGGASFDEIDSDGWSDDDWLLFLPGNCVLSDSALTKYGIEACDSELQLIYSDHDAFDTDDRRHDPVFTWQWSPEQLISHNYIGDVYLLRYRHCKQEFVSPGAIKPYRALIRLGLPRSRVRRIPEVLWSEPDRAVAVQERRREEDELVAEYLKECAVPARLECGDLSRSLLWPLSKDPLVSIIIPTMGKLDLVRPCISSLLEKTAYDNYEIIILDNSRGANADGITWLRNHQLTVIECDEPFNWARLNNLGAEKASGDLLLFLNDDIEITQADWLSELVRQAQREEIGAVGCKLLYPNGALQHAGVFLVNYGGGGLHLLHKLQPGPDIYLRLDLHVREVSANTGACLLVSRNKYDEVKGFDEELAVVGNDVDFCLKLMAKGYRNLWTPRCSLIHHESISREAQVPQEDEQASWRRWGELFKQGDPYYNPNLTLAKWDCSQEFDVPAKDLLAKSKDFISAASVSPATSLRPGVNVIGYIRADMGLGEAVRSDARALQAAGLDFGVINFETGNPGRMTNLSWRHKEILSAPYDINLIHINGDMLELAMDELPNHFFKRRYNIAYWAWELETIPDSWIHSLSLIDEIWTPSRFVQAAVSKATEKPVLVIPHNIDLSEDPGYGKEHFRLPEEAFIFLAMYDTRSIAMRKNPQAAVRAFKQAFPGDDTSVCLVLKLNNATSEDLDSLATEMSSHDNIVIVDGNHSRAEIDGLLRCIDCYVSLHRSEGFGLGPAEAMSLGVPCILTNWSGNTDYMNEDNCLAVDYSLVELEEDYGPYNKGQRWADADIDQAAAHMRKLPGDPELTARLGAAARLTIEQDFSPSAIGKLVSSRIEQIRQQAGGESDSQPVETA